MTVFTATRRKMLIWSASVSTPLLSGCSSILPDQHGQILLKELIVSNLHDEPHLFDVMIREMQTDRVVFWDSYTAREMADRSGDGYSEVGGRIWEYPVESPGDYVVYARAERTVPANDDEWESARLKTDGDCLRVEIEVDRNGYLSIQQRYRDEC